MNKISMIAASAGLGIIFGLPLPAARAQTATMPNKLEGRVNALGEPVNTSAVSRQSMIDKDREALEKIEAAKKRGYDVSNAQALYSQGHLEVDSGDYERALRDLEAAEVAVCGNPGLSPTRPYSAPNEGLHPSAPMGETSER